MVLSEGELERWGGEIGQAAVPPLFICLRGELGAGKSVLARAIARGAGVEGNMPSPTYNLVFRYPTPSGADLIHMDLYRLGAPEEVWELGWSEVQGHDGIVLVEWPERVEAFLPEPRWEVSLESVPDDPLSRLVQASRVGDPPDLPAFPLRVDQGGSA